MHFEYVPIDRIFSKLTRDVGSDFSEGDVIEWAGEALEHIGAIKQYEDAVAFIEVKNHQCELPRGLHAIIQVARNNHWNGPKDDTLCPKNISTLLSEVIIIDDGPVIPVAIDELGMPVNAYDVAYYRPYFDLRFPYNSWCNSSLCRQMYTPVRLSTNTFFNELVCRTEDDEHIYKSCQDEYNVIGKKMLRFSFREGSVAVAYARQPLDEKGYPMIPDDISYTEAIIRYVAYKMFTREFYNNREGADRKMIDAEQKWNWYCRQAGNKAMMPRGIDDHQNLLDQRSYLLPRRNRYYGFFGKLNLPEKRLFNYPNGR